MKIFVKKTHLLLASAQIEASRIQAIVQDVQ